MQYADIGIDLGTSSVLIHIKGKGVVLKEPSVIAQDCRTNKVLAIGESARLMLGKQPNHIIVKKPLNQGVISDYAATTEMISYFIHKAIQKKHLRKPLIAICAPCCITEVERKAVEDAAYQVGARRVIIIEEPLAAAIGAGVDITKPRGTMIVDIGGGTSDISVVSLNSIIVSKSIKIAGDSFDISIIRYIQKRYNLLIGAMTAEYIKIKLGYIHPHEKENHIAISGRNLVTGLPQVITIHSSEMKEALREPISQIVDAVYSVLERTPPELSADIAERGIVLTGGSSLLHGIETTLSEKTGLNTMTAEDPMITVARGLGKCNIY